MGEMQLDELELIKKAQNGDESSFEALILSYKGKAYNIALSYTKNEADAMDVLQESFIKVYKYLPRFKGDSAFGTWMYRVVVNSCKDFLRQNNKYNNVEPLLLEGDDGEWERELRSDLPTPQEELDRKELADELLECMEKLHTEHKEIIILRDIQNMSYEEISAITGKPIGTVKSRLSRARNQLKSIWMEQSKKSGV